MSLDLSQKVYHTECGGFFENLRDAKRHQKGCFCEKIESVPRYEDVPHYSLLMQMQKWEMDQLAWEEPVRPLDRFEKLYADSPKLW